MLSANPAAVLASSLVGGLVGVRAWLWQPVTSAPVTATVAPVLTNSRRLRIRPGLGWVMCCTLPYYSTGRPLSIQFASPP